MARPPNGGNKYLWCLICVLSRTIVRTGRRTDPSGRRQRMFNQLLIQSMLAQNTVLETPQNIGSCAREPTAERTASTADWGRFSFSYSVVRFKVADMKAVFRSAIVSSPLVMGMEMADATAVARLFVFPCVGGNGWCSDGALPRYSFVFPLLLFSHTALLFVLFFSRCIGNGLD